METLDPKAAPTPAVQTARQRRLAQALRDNLRRRKDAKTPSPPSENNA